MSEAPTKIGVAGLVAAAAWVGIAVTLASFVGGLLWPLELLVHFHGCFALVLSAGALVCLALRQRRTGFAAIAVAIADAAFVLPLYFGASLSGDSANAPATLRVLTANVATQNRKVQPLLDLVAREKPDLVAIQEINQSWQLALGPLRASHPFYVESPREDNFGIALYSRHRCTDIREIEFGVPEVPSIRADIVAPSGRFTAITTHPLPPSPLRRPVTRDRQLRLIAEHLRTIDGPKILLGDLNTSSWTDQFRDLCDGTGMRDSREGFGLRATWPSRLVPFAIAIDHVLVSEEFRVVDHRVSASIGSDHRAVVVDLRTQ